jgi:hypothetical protein
MLKTPYGSIVTSGSAAEQPKAWNKMQCGIIQNVSAPMPMMIHHQCGNNATKKKPNSPYGNNSVCSINCLFKDRPDDEVIK